MRHLEREGENRLQHRKTKEQARRKENQRGENCANKIRVALFRNDSDKPAKPFLASLLSLLFIALESFLESSSFRLQERTRTKQRKKRTATKTKNNKKETKAKKID